MDRQKILFQLKAMMSNFETYIKEVKIKDTIGYKEVFKEIISLVTLAVNNQLKLPDYELVNVARLCVSAKELRNIQNNQAVALNNLEIIRQQIRHEKDLLKEVYYIKDEIPRPLQRPLSAEKSTSDVPVVDKKNVEKVITETTSSTQTKTPVEEPIKEEKAVIQKNEPIKVNSETPNNALPLESELEILGNAMDECSRDYVLNRTRLEGVGFNDHDEEIYSSVAHWCGRASSFAKTLESSTDSASIDYGIKFLKNAVVLTKLMSLALNSKDATSFRTRLNALENNLNKMEEYYRNTQQKAI